ncbi:MAG: hypothetical protein AAFQ11_00485 [Pseudomonadota bacterium]
MQKSRALSLCALVLGYALGFAQGLATQPAHASDYSFQCASADGLYVIFDQELFDAEQYRTGQPPAISHSKIGDVILEERTGVCRVRRGPLSGRNYEYLYRQFLRKVRFRVRGERVSVTLLCEEVSDGLPAAANCDQRRETGRFQASISQPSRDLAPKTETPGRELIDPQLDPDLARQSRYSVWEDDGSLIRLYASGNKRAFVYERPNNSLQQAGVRKGSLLFQGRRVRSRYVGTAYIYAGNCGAQPFEVSGRVSNNQTRVDLRGDVVRRTTGCRPNGLRSARFILDLVP